MSHSKVDLESLMQFHPSSVLVCVCCSENSLCQGRQSISSANTGPFGVSGYVFVGQGKLVSSSSYTGPFEIQRQYYDRTLCDVNLQNACYEDVVTMCYELFVSCSCSLCWLVELARNDLYFLVIKWIVQLQGF